jgi:flagellar basal-body rod protein FlgB
MGLIQDILYTNKTGALAKKALDIYDKRFQLVNSNIANAETPGYKSVDVKPFERELSRAFQGTAAMKVTDPRHMQGGMSDISTFEPGLAVSIDEPRIDGNNVDLDKEVVKMTEIGTMYDAVMAARSKRGTIISAAVDLGGGR